MTQLENIIKSRNPKNTDEIKSILREIVQSVVLIGLSRAGFFKHASFYGGTALRIFYGLNRYSEDLDFTLNKKDELFNLSTYTSSIINYAKSLGLDLIIENKIKTFETLIESAFAKLNTYNSFITLNIDKNLADILHKDELIKVKLEIDCNPALGFNTVSKWIDIPEYAPVIVLDDSSLFAGKIHAILCRNYKNTVKGRDYYDFLFYIRNRVKPNINYLKNKLVESGKLKEDDEFNIDILKSMLMTRFNEVDFNQVIEDSRKFVFTGEDTSYMNKELFIDMLNRL